MKRLTQEEISASHRVYNHVEGMVHYYGPKTVDDVIPLTSLNRWIVFPVKNIDSVQEARSHPAPNVYVHFYDGEISDDGAGRPVASWLGVTCHNDGAMTWLGDFLDPRRRRRNSFLLSLLQGLSDGFSVNVTHKVSDCPNGTPKYDVMFSECPSNVTIEWIRDSIRESDRQLPPVGSVYRTGNIVLGRITVFGIEVQADAGTFDDCIREAFDFFFKLISPRP